MPVQESFSCEQLWCSNGETSGMHSEPICRNFRLLRRQCNSKVTDNFQIHIIKLEESVLNTAKTWQALMQLRQVLPENKFRGIACRRQQSSILW